MCGIYGILTSRDPRPAVEVAPQEALGKNCDRLLELDPSTDEALGDAALELLSAAHDAARRFVQKAGFLSVFENADLAGELAARARAVRQWVAALEERARRGTLGDQRQIERLNQRVVAGADLAWCLERDVLGNIEPVAVILGGAVDGARLETLAHGWSLNLVLNGIDRLEVRGRDSAGLAVYVRFPSRAALESFVEQVQRDTARGKVFRERCQTACFSHGAILRPASAPDTLLFAFKVAEEVGKMGDNVRVLRREIAADAVFQACLRQEAVDIQVLAHTRWASNGIVSLENCHPVDSAIVEPIAGSDGAPFTQLSRAGEIVAVLNGDIDNYQDLCSEFVHDVGSHLEEPITTDAKIVPVVIDAFYRECGDLREAFATAVERFEGSMAIGVMAAACPGEFLFAQKGSGQGLYLGRAPATTVIASEMYGLVELTSSYVKADGEKSSRGECFVVSQGECDTTLHKLSGPRSHSIPEDRLQQAEITTRDINRGTFPHFLLKEVTESVETVRKTLRGKFDVTGEGAPRFLLGDEVIASDRLESFVRGDIRKIVAVGQGTAAIAADGIAALLRRALKDASHALEITSMKATELSAYELRQDMSDTLVIAVSQSGTTTDTNRTVDLARERGAWIIGIVNRRNSDLVYKSHGVLYTSDGRDIEMSVASTKAFYAQNVAGQILALALAQSVGALDAKSMRRALRDLEMLPESMQTTLGLQDEIADLAGRFATRKRYWAMVGSGPGKVAADEIRIKLSELCYKSIASDFVEDKKHIDLSSEPLVLVCASGIPRRLVSDVVKEVAIFKAHQSVPIVITEEGEKRFDPYASGVIRVPAYRGALGYLLSTMVGHLFGYFAACAFDEHADRLRRIRSGLLKVARRNDVEERGTDVAETALPDELIDGAREVRDALLDGALDSCLEAGTSTRLALALHALLARSPVDLQGLRFGDLDREATPVDRLLHVVSLAITELERPIDAIKHQAKTVTVGISRGEVARPRGVLWEVFEGHDLEALIPQSQRAFLEAFEPLVARIEGTTLYRARGLDALGRPRDGSTVVVVDKTGCASEMPSRCDTEQPLAGTKWGVARRAEVYLGRGQTDGRRILIVPAMGEKSVGHLVLLHLRLTDDRDRATRMRALKSHPDLLEELRIAITEQNQIWDPQLLDLVDNDTLFFDSPEHVAERIAGQLAG